jgi:hypothetical protein
MNTALTSIDKELSFFPTTIQDKGLTITSDASFKLGSSSSPIPQSPTQNPNPSPFFKDPSIFCDFNGDGKTDIFWRNENTGQTGLWLMNGKTYSDATLLDVVDKAWNFKFGDFNGDGKTDIFWRNENTGQNGIWLMNGKTYSDAVLLETVDKAWDNTIGDFNGDGKSDIFWRNRDTGENGVWLMNGKTYSDAGILDTVGKTWELAIADFNGDGKTDIFWRNYSASGPDSGKNGLWLMNGKTYSDAALLETVGKDWYPSIVDFNGDGKTDIFWRNYSTGSDGGKNGTWLMNGKTISDAGLLDTVDIGWYPSIGDFNGDGKTDIFWRNDNPNSIDNGKNGIWLMNGKAYSNAALLESLSSTQGWLLDIGDFNGDGKTDVFWRNTNSDNQQDKGKNGTWLMNGTKYNDAGLLEPITDTNWYATLNSFSYIG